SQTITIESIADKLITDAPFEVTASSSASLELTYEVSGPATIDGNMITLSGETGEVTVTVSQAGNENYLSASASATFQVTDPAKQSQTITFAAIADKTYGDAPFSLAATASSELPVTLEIVSGPATLDGTVVTITGAGNVTIRATQSGNDDFNAASAV